MLFTGNSAVASFTENCWLLDPQSGKVQRKLPGHGDAARAVAFAPDGKTLAVGCYDHDIHLWDHAEGKLVQKLSAHTGIVYCVAFSPDGKTLASSCEDNSVRLWDVQSGKTLRHWDDYDSVVRCVAFAPKGSWLATASWDGTLKIRDPDKDRVLLSLVGDGSPDWVAIHPSGKNLAVGWLHGKVHVYDLDVRDASAEERQQIQKLIALWEDDRLSVRDQASRELIRLGVIAEPLLRQAAKESPSAEVRIRAREARKSIQASKPAAVLNTHRGSVLWGAYSPDGDLLATVGQDGFVVLWDTKKYQVKAKLQWPL
jgi:WD40 repeat protein